MFFKSSRKLLCFILTVIIAVGVFAFAGATVLRATLCTEDYISYFLSSSKLTEYCDSVYEKRIAVLADNSGVPVRVFDATENIEGYTETVARRFFDGSDTSLFTQDRIDTYEKLIKEYLDGNEIKYKADSVHNTAVEAAEIYADSYGIKNTETFKNFVDDYTSVYGKISSASLAAVAVAVLLIFIMFSEKRKASACYASAFTAAGLACVFTGAIAIIFGVGKGGNITPEIYSDLIFSAINLMLVIFMLVGVAMTAASVVASLRYNKLTKRTRNS